MQSTTETEKLELLKSLQQQGEAAGLVAKFSGYGVLVICLPVYGAATEQLLLNPAPETVPLNRQ